LSGDGRGASGSVRGPRGGQGAGVGRDKRPFLEDADDLGEVAGGEAVATAEPGERNPSASGLLLDPPLGAAEDIGDLGGPVEDGQVVGSG
jgi:hypothetical protein